MTADEYWNGDPMLAIAYREAHELKIRARNQELWLQGLYNFNAFSTALSNLHFDSKPHKANKYLEKPIDLYGDLEREHKEEVRKARETIIERLNRIKSAWDKGK